MQGDHDALVLSSHLPRRRQPFGAAPTIFGLMTARGSTSFARIAAGRREAAGLGRSEPVSQGHTVSPAVWRKDHRQSHHHRINYDSTNGVHRGVQMKKLFLGSVALVALGLGRRRHSLPIGRCLHMHHHRRRLRSTPGAAATLVQTRVIRPDAAHRPRLRTPS